MSKTGDSPIKQPKRNQKQHCAPHPEGSSPLPSKKSRLPTRKGESQTKKNAPTSSFLPIQDYRTSAILSSAPQISSTLVKSKSLATSSDAKADQSSTPSFLPIQDYRTSAILPSAPRSAAPWSRESPWQPPVMQRLTNPQGLDTTSEQ